MSIILSLGSVVASTPIRLAAESPVPAGPREAQGDSLSEPKKEAVFLLISGVGSIPDPFGIQTEISTRHLAIPTVYLPNCLLTTTRILLGEQTIHYRRSSILRS